MDENGEMELKAQHQGKVRYKKSSFHETLEERMLIGIVIENCTQSILD